MKLKNYGNKVHAIIETGSESKHKKLIYFGFDTHNELNSIWWHFSIWKKLPIMEYPGFCYAFYLYYLIFIKNRIVPKRGPKLFLVGPVLYDTPSKF